MVVPDEVKFPTLISFVVVAPLSVTESSVSASVAVKLMLPPRETAAPPESIPLVFMVMAEFASSLLATQPEQVRSVAEIVPVPVTPNEAPVPTTIAAVVLVPDVIEGEWGSGCSSQGNPGSSVIEIDLIICCVIYQGSTPHGDWV